MVLKDHQPLTSEYNNTILSYCNSFIQRIVNFVNLANCFSTHIVCFSFTKEKGCQGITEYLNRFVPSTMDELPIEQSHA